MAYKEHGPPVPGYFIHLAEALLLKRDVADRQHFVDDQDFRFEVGRDCEGESNRHTGGIMFDGRVEKLFSFGKGDNLIKLTFDLVAGHSQHGAVEKDVFASGKFGMKSGTDFEQTSYSSV